MLFASSLHAMMGPGGMASFGHAAWFGIGADASPAFNADANGAANTDGRTGRYFG